MSPCAGDLERYLDIASYRQRWTCEAVVVDTIEAAGEHEIRNIVGVSGLETRHFRYPLIADDEFFCRVPTTIHWGRHSGRRKSSTHSTSAKTGRRGFSCLSLFTKGLCFRLRPQLVLEQSLRRRSRPTRRSDFGMRILNTCSSS